MFISDVFDTVCSVFFMCFAAVLPIVGILRIQIVRIVFSFRVFAHECFTWKVAWYVECLYNSCSKSVHQV